MKTVKNVAWLLEMHVSVGIEDIWVFCEHFLATGNLFLFLSVAEGENSHLWRPVGTGGQNTLQSHTIHGCCWHQASIQYNTQKYTEVIHDMYVWDVKLQQAPNRKTVTWRTSIYILAVQNVWTHLLSLFVFDYNNNEQETILYWNP